MSGQTSGLPSSGSYRKENNMWTLAFWKEAIERAIKTGSQFLLGFWFFDQSNIVGALELDFAGGLSIFVSGFVLSILTSVIFTPISGKNSPSLTK